MQKTLWALTQYFRQYTHHSPDDFLTIRDCLVKKFQFPFWFREMDFLNHLQRAESVFKKEISGRWISMGDEDFPSAFYRMKDPCYGFFLLGNSIWQTNIGFAVVGARDVSAQSETWLEEQLKPVLLHDNYFVASGGARGVDQIAHRICLRTKRPTLVFLPSGIENIYPRSLSSWRDLVLQGGGGFISEYEPQVSMRKTHFAERNRLIAAIGFTTLVIEASRKSGTMLTARAAIDHGKPLLVLPGHPYDQRSQGSVDLICEGATPIRDKEDLALILRCESRPPYRDLSEEQQL